MTSLSFFQPKESITEEESIKKEMLQMLNEEGIDGVQAAYLKNAGRLNKDNYIPVAFTTNAEAQASYLVQLKQNHSQKFIPQEDPESSSMNHSHT
jgi:hypothetical protein